MRAVGLDHRDVAQVLVAGDGVELRLRVGRLLELERRHFEGGEHFGEAERAFLERLFGDVEVTRGEVPEEERGQRRDRQR